MKKYFILTFGCQMNISDSERIASIFESMKISKTLKVEEADFVIANMCSVRQSAVDRIFGLSNRFRELKKKNKKLKLILTGCVLDPDKDKFIHIFDYERGQCIKQFCLEIINEYYCRYKPHD